MKHGQKNLIPEVSVKGAENSDNLVLLLHGIDSNIIKMEGLIRVIEDKLDSVRILFPELPLAWNNLYDFKELGRQVLLRMNEEIEKHTQGGYKRIYIIGHSSGGVLAQVVYILSRFSELSGGLAKYNSEQLQIVLLAPISRGWEINHHLPVTYKIAWALGLSIMTPFHLVASFAKKIDWEPWLLQIRRGSPLITWLRLSWQKIDKDHPLVVELLGSKDEIVSWHDMVDASASDTTIFYDVPNSNHAELVEFEHEQFGKVRESIFRNALNPNLSKPEKNDFRIHSIEGGEVHPILPWDEEPIPPDPQVKRVVFVIHGIRDEGHWTQKIANRARAVFSAEGEGTREQIAVVTSSYGYFSMLQFLLPWERRKKVAWLVDLYIEARRKYPNAKFSYIGHSHGTFLAVKALDLHDEICFERIAFAGSVVNRGYDWAKLLELNRVSRVLNFSASADWVVGIFPKLAQIKPIGLIMGQELGSAGCDPFNDSDKDSRVINNEYIKGSHGAAIKEQNWDELARFVVKNEIPPESTDEYTKTPCRLFHGVLGWLTCIFGWSFLLFMGLYLLPLAAMSEPTKFWGVGLGSVLAGAILVSLIHPMVRSRDRDFRNRFQKLSSAFLIFVFVAIGLFWVYLGIKSIWFDQEASYLSVNAAVNSGRSQMASVVAYFILLWTALTKV